MFQIVTGGSGSGKSAFAEALAMELGKKRYYIATMYPFGEDIILRRCILSGKNLSKKLQDIGQCGQRNSLRQLNVIQT